MPVWALSQIFNFVNLRNLVPRGRAYYYTGGLTKKMLITIIIIVVQVKAILVNIFGGIVNCATIANGIIAACKEIQLSLPLVVRLEGEDMQNNNINH